MTQTTHADAPPSCTTADRKRPQTRLNELLHGRGWLPDLHVMTAMREVDGASVPMLPDWNQIDSDWTYEPSVTGLDRQAHAYPTLLGIDEGRPDTLLLSYPYPAAGQGEESWCLAHRPTTMTFPLTHQGLDVLEQLLPAIEAYRIDDQEIASCVAGEGGCRTAPLAVA
ncbi:hypothetical protein [Streptomyces sp. NPDC018059]|uniref:hypothetical protein n=1 Tax=Streptomyces sp. NPDC018059 TaxID=3365041 RepID=UPI003791FCBE